MHGFINHLIATLLAAVAVSTLAACTGDPAPVGTVPDGSPVTSAGVAATPEPTRPVEAATPESAIQFTRYFWDLYNYAYQTYDTAPLKAISDPLCKFCASTISGAEVALKNKTRTEGADIKVIELASPPVKITSGTSVVCALSQTAGKTIDAAGVETSLPAVKRIRSTLGLAWSSDGWTVHGVDYEVQ